MIPRWFSARQDDDAPAGPESRGVGLEIPSRSSDCTGKHPSWRPFEVNVCDVDAPDPEPLTARERSTGFWGT